MDGDGCCDHGHEPAPVSQTLDEMDFERGIWGASIEGDAKRVEKLLAKGVSANSRDSSGYTPMHYAAR